MVGRAKSVDAFLAAGLRAIRCFERNGKVGAVGAVLIVLFFPESSSYHMRYLQPLELENVGDMVIR